MDIFQRHQGHAMNPVKHILSWGLGLFFFASAYGQTDYSPDGVRTFISSGASQQQVGYFIEDFRVGFSVPDTALYFQVFKDLRQDAVRQKKEAMVVHIDLACAVIYYQLFMYPEALPIFEHCVQRYEALEDHEMAGYVYYFMSWVHYEELPVFLKYARASCDHFKHVSGSGIKCMGIMTLGIAYHSNNMPDSALKYLWAYYREARALNNHRVHVPQALGKIGTFYYLSSEKAKYDSARKYYRLQWDAAQKDSTQKSLMTAAINMASLADDEGRYDDALHYLKLAAGVANRYKNDYTTRFLKRRMAEVHANAGQFEDAYQGFVDYHEYHDSIITKQNSKEIAALERKYEWQKKETAIAVLQRDKAQQHVVIYVVLGLLVMLLIIACFLWMNNRLKQRRNVALKKSHDSIKTQKQQIEQQRDKIELLIKEIYHRTKNNLQLISSLLNLQMAEVDDPRVFDAMMKNRNQLNSMVLIHQRLYQDDEMTDIPMKSYLQNLSQELERAFAEDLERVQIICAFDDIALDIDTAIPIGLIVNELITNALKHAFQKQNEGVIEVVLKRYLNGTIFLSVSDNGSGILAQKTGNSQQNGFGARLIRLLTHHLDGTLEVLNGDGTTVQILFKSMKLQTL